MTLDELRADLVMRWKAAFERRPEVVPNLYNRLLLSGDVVLAEQRFVCNMAGSDPRLARLSHGKAIDAILKDPAAYFLYVFLYAVEDGITRSATEYHEVAGKVAHRSGSARPRMGSPSGWVIRAVERRKVETPVMMRKRLPLVTRAVAPKRFAVQCRIVAFAVSVISCLAVIVGTLPGCSGGAAQCGAGVNSLISFSGAAGLPDDAIKSLVITACLNSECWTASQLLGGGMTPLPDAATPTFRYGGWSFTQIHSGLYTIKDTISLDEPPTGSLTPATASVVIKSKGVTLYEKTVMNVVCEQRPAGCGGPPSEDCTVSLP